MARKHKQTNEEVVDSREESLPEKLPEAKELTGDEEDDFADDGNLDFGGLPDRDLKKNLGCG